ncbi:uncharacterized protein B0H18DRAFT_996936 [Fomitopsis serialis]|uniref:uncharacterized protein n=1 Tax=Fomitopsis serialis TaxID=139415 RepID=UPI0020075BA8|nr:uncharacterized protein B0H18DRAFT_996936 [Neoantrodia serialis]KAH9929393.1 hypothetical protein B0H18DRAFT_996936 [Neoantrodia serialis]
MILHSTLGAVAPAYLFCIKLQRTIHRQSKQNTTTHLETPFRRRAHFLKRCVLVFSCSARSGSA